MDASVRTYNLCAACPARCAWPAAHPGSQSRSAEKVKPQTPADQQKAAAKSAPSKTRDDLTTRIDPPHNASHRPATSGIDSGGVISPNSVPARPQTSSAKPAFTSAGGTSTKAAAGASSKSTTQFISGDDTDDDSQDTRKLSLAERKRLRKQQRGDRYGDE